jgi:hypothetical protein
VTQLQDAPPLSDCERLDALEEKIGSIEEKLERITQALRHTTFAVELMLPEPPCPGCTHSDDEWHDELLTLFVENPIAAVNLILDDGQGPSELGEAARFINEHNWPDPVAMGQLGEWLKFWTTIEGRAHECARTHSGSPA